MKEKIKKLFKQFGFEIKKYSKDNDHSYKEKLVPLKHDGNNPQGAVLFSYMIEPFLLSDGDAMPNSHTHYWESFAIAKILVELGYNVDVVSYMRKTTIPQKPYDIFLGVRINFEKIVKSINADCLKIVHLDTAHWLKNNTENYKHALDFQERRGVTIRGAKLVDPNWAIEYADCATVLGNDYTIDTYRYAKKKLYRVPISTCHVYHYPEDKNFDSVKKNYLWFGSSDFIHKGLDLVLDAFSAMPDYHIYVCGPMEQEKKFEEAYFEELYHSPNIHTVGWIDVTSAKFIDLCNTCIGIVYPSCSEGGGGSVIQCMHAGLIPIASYESSVDLGSFGVKLKRCRVDDIKHAIKEVSGYTNERLGRMSRDSWNFARQNHKRETFSKNFKEVIVQITNDFSAKYPKIRI